MRSQPTHSAATVSRLVSAIRDAYPFLLLAACALALAGCNAADRLANIGREPVLSPIENPTAAPGYQPVTLPMPEPERIVYQPNSLWREGSRSFFKDQRAAVVGDILTVNIDITDSATVNNKTERTRGSREQSDFSSFLGYEDRLDKIFPGAVDPEELTDFGSDSNARGEGTVDRKEEVKLTVAAVVTQILPNGNLVIEGRQEVRVNFEVRELLVHGVVRPEDITSRNTIEHTQIAEARISYGGRGQISDVQQPRYGQQVYDVVWPW